MTCSRISNVNNLLKDLSACSGLLTTETLRGVCYFWQVSSQLSAIADFLSLLFNFKVIVQVPMTQIELLPHEAHIRTDTHMQKYIRTD